MEAIPKIIASALMERYQGFGLDLAPSRIITSGALLVASGVARSTIPADAPHPTWLLQSLE